MAEGMSGPGLHGAVDLSSLVRSRETGTEQAGAPNGEAGQAPQGVVSEATDSNFQAVVELSARVPVVVEFYAQGIQPSLASLVGSYGGRLALAVVDGNANPQLAQAFQVQQVPAVAAVIGGRPMQLFVGMPGEAEIRQVFDQLLQVAAENGISGSIPVEDAGTPQEEQEPELPPLHQEAYDAISRADYSAAIAAYDKAISQDPRDALAIAGRAQAALLMRLADAESARLREAAAENPQDVDAQLAVADLDVSGGHVDDAFGRLLDLFPGLAADDKDRVRARLVEYFEIVGTEDPRVLAARRRLATLLY